MFIVMIIVAHAASKLRNEELIKQLQEMIEGVDAIGDAGKTRAWQAKMKEQGYP